MILLNTQFSDMQTCDAV